MPSDAVQQAHRAHQVDVKGSGGVAVALPHDRLGREVEDHLGLERVEEPFERVRVPDVSDDRT